MGSSALNGSGKTTFLKLILGELTPDAGYIVRDKRLSSAYMAQEIDLDPEETAFEVVRQGAAEVLALEAQLEQLEAKFADPDYYTHEKRLARLIDQQEQVLTAYNQQGGPGLEGQITALLTNIGFQAYEFDLPIKTSQRRAKKAVGGWRASSSVDPMSSCWTSRTITLTWMVSPCWQN
jgi:ATP-binding cassette, subfamily F, member 3